MMNFGPFGNYAVKSYCPGPGKLDFLTLLRLLRAVTDSLELIVDYFSLRDRTLLLPILEPVLEVSLTMVTLLVASVFIID